MENTLSNKLNKANKKILIILILIVLILLGIAGYFYYKLGQLDQENDFHKNKISDLESSLQDTRGQLSDSEKNTEILFEKLILEQEKNDEFEGQINTLGSTVGDLEKLSKTDKELLQKYSKIFFLNEHYVPPRVTSIKDAYVYDPEKNLQIHKDVWPFLEDLLKEASGDGIDLQIVSAYRSFGTQASLKNNYVVTYGAGTANQFSADQGYSEHQLGTTIDFTTSELGAGFTKFSQTEAYQWLLDNAYKYGFVLSYPEGNTYYSFEPWHWRFVSKDLARKLHNNDENFYDWNQRDIDEYLIDFFD